MSRKDGPTSELTTQAYFSYSWKMLRDNYKAFILTEIFAVISFLLTMTVFIFLLYLISLLVPDFSLRDLAELIRTRIGISVAFRMVVSIIVGVVLMGFMNCQYGLANDIINSGEMFAQFKGSFTYFKKNWWQFFFLTILLTGFFSILPLFLTKPVTGPPESLNLSFWNFIFLGLRLALYFIWYILFIHAFPSVVYKNNLLTALRESFTIFRQEFRKIVKIWGIFFLAILLPSILIALFGIFLHSEVQSGPHVPIIAFVLLLAFIFVSFPFSALLATGIYNNSGVVRSNRPISQEGRSANPPRKIQDNFDEDTTRKAGRSVASHENDPSEGDTLVDQG